jgi:transcriptional regulator with XRE-family HTH domain
MARKGDKPPHFIRSWRKHRGLTLEQLAERIGMSHQNLGKIERYKVPYNEELLELLADALRCETGDIIMRDPSKSDGIWSLWETIAGLNPAEARQAVEVVKALKRTGTDG